MVQAAEQLQRAKSLGLARHSEIIDRNWLYLVVFVCIISYITVVYCNCNYCISITGHINIAP